ncbi:glycosyltransferase [Leptolyngbya sp. 'hensonii']|uniref:glycosyltransferase n=1 Tax=Leptolyngbya sp. 'hensonii' TaxID=1922337 RepID=UPI00094F9DC4|nr:glycosyltransferase [Leptolyngbya sp. 'hensonii']OLP20305.1 glycosyltransferase [Leptolyngbya sp. 'hensonii']
MRSLYFLVPGTGGKFACGGLWAELKTLHLARQICAAEVVTYRQREPEVLFLDDLLRQPQRTDIIFVVSWGFDVPKLVRRLQGWPVLYHAHSAGYGFRLPAQIPIVAVSRNTMGYWGQQAPHSPIYYLPNQISDEFCDRSLQRDIDVLVQARKSSGYLLQELVPALRSQCRVELITSYVEDLPGLFNRSKIYLYDSAEYWSQQRVSEGFGLPPMEALACGCQVFSSVNGALADYLDPGFTGHKIAVYSREYDLQRILQVLQAPPGPVSELFFAEYRTPQILPRLQQILIEINQFFDHQVQYPATIQELTRWRLAQLSTRRLWSKIRQRLWKPLS